MLTPTIRPLFATDQFGVFSREVDRLFNTGAGRASRSDGASPGSALVPAISVWQDEGSIHVEVDVPGFRAEDLDIEVHERVVTVSGRREITPATGSSALVSERASGSFRRAVRAPFAVDADGVKASLESGVLRVHVPQSEATKSRRVAIHRGVDAATTTLAEPADGDAPADNDAA